ncbi:MAG: thioredoxin family protein [Opitutales bacterium]
MFLFANKLFIALVVLSGAVLTAYFVQRESPAIAAEPAAEGDWLTSWGEASMLASDLDRPVFMLFTGSEWCPPCVYLENNALNTQTFVDYADASLVLLKYDFPQRGTITDEMQRMAQKYDGGRLPTWVLVRSDGTELGRGLGVPRGGADELLERLHGFGK